jgi:hypothetical protein
MLDRQHYQTAVRLAREAVEECERKCRLVRADEIMRRVDAEYPDADAAPVLMDVVCRRAGVKYEKYAEAHAAQEEWRNATDRLRSAREDLADFDARKSMSGQ